MKEFFLADDLSGALDAAAAFHRARRRVTVTWDFTGWEQADDEIIGITTETRNASPQEAAAVVAETMARARRASATLVYKKMDSTLRGPVAAETAALAAALPETRILFAPANPGVGRTVRAGVLHVHGVPVAETEFGRDPLSPVRESDIRRLLGAAATPRVIIAETETENDLVTAVARMEAGGESWVGIGSGALARPVAARRRVGAGISEPPPLPPGPILMVGGSAHRVNRRQAARLAEERGVPVVELTMTDPAAAIRRAIAGIREKGGATLLIEERRDDSAKVARQVTAAAAEIAGTTGVRRMFVTGGETAFALCREWGVAALTFRAEIESGLSVSQTKAAGARLLAIKPGGFGDEGTWIRAWDALASR